MPEGSPLAGTTVAQLNARKIKDLLVVALRDPAGAWHYNPEEHERLGPGMTIVFMGSPEARTKLEHLLLR